MCGCCSRVDDGARRLKYRKHLRSSKLSLYTTSSILHLPTRFIEKSIVVLNQPLLEVVVAKAGSCSFLANVNAWTAYLASDGASTAQASLALPFNSFCEDVRKGCEIEIFTVSSNVEEVLDIEGQLELFANDIDQNCFLNTPRPIRIATESNEGIHFD